MGLSNQRTSRLNATEIRAPAFDSQSTSRRESSSSCDAHSSTHRHIDTCPCAARGRGPCVACYALAGSPRSSRPSSRGAPFLARPLLTSLPRSGGSSSSEAALTQTAFLFPEVSGRANLFATSRMSSSASASATASAWTAATRRSRSEHAFLLARFASSRYASVAGTAFLTNGACVLAAFAQVAAWPSRTIGIRGCSTTGAVQGAGRGATTPLEPRLRRLAAAAASRLVGREQLCRRAAL